MSDERKMITPLDLKDGQVKVVVYSYKGCSIIVPDPSWNMKGDLSRLPPDFQGILAVPNKNHVSVSQAVIDDSSQTRAIPSGRKALSDIRAKGFHEISRVVMMTGETEVYDNKIQ